MIPHTAESGGPFPYRATKVQSHLFPFRSPSLAKGELLRPIHAKDDFPGSAIRASQAAARSRSKPITHSGGNRSPVRSEATRDPESWVAVSLGSSRRRSARLSHGISLCGAGGLARPGRGPGAHPPAAGCRSQSWTNTVPHSVSNLAPLRITSEQRISERGRHYAAAPRPFCKPPVICSSSSPRRSSRVTPVRPVSRGSIYRRTLERLWTRESRISQISRLLP